MTVPQASLLLSAHTLPAAAHSSRTVKLDGFQFDYTCRNSLALAHYQGDTDRFQGCLQTSYEHDENKKGL